MSGGRLHTGLTKPVGEYCSVFYLSGWNRDNKVVMISQDAY